MRNLAHMPIEKLEEIPTHLSMKWNPHSGWTLKPYDRYYRDNWAYLRLYNKLDRIVKASIGKNWNDIYSKLTVLTRNISYGFKLDHFLSNEVEIPHWSTKDQRWKFMGGYNSYEVDLEYHIANLKRTYGNSTINFYYVCPVSGVLRLVKSRIWPYKKRDHAEFWRRHYKFASERKKKKKKEHIPEAIYTMINNRELFKFYTEIKSNYTNRLKVLAKGLKPIPKDYWSKWNVYTHNSNYKKFSEDQVTLQSMKDQIEELEKGNFDGFFESAVYLYSK